MDMARLRASLAPGLGVPVVRCEGCGTWAARRCLAGARRRARRVWSAARGLVFAAFVTVALFAPLVMSVVLVGGSLGQYGLSGVNPRPTVILLALLSAATGLWLTLGLGHAPLWGLVAGWFVAGGFCASLDVIATRLMMAVMGGRISHASAQELAGRAVVLAILLGLTLVFCVAGLLIRRSAPAIRSRRWRRRLTHLRRARASA